MRKLHLYVCGVFLFFGVMSCKGRGILDNSTVQAAAKPFAEMWGCGARGSSPYRSFGLTFPIDDPKWNEGEPIVHTRVTYATVTMTGEPQKITVEKNNLVQMGRGTILQVKLPDGNDGTIMLADATHVGESTADGNADFFFGKFQAFLIATTKKGEIYSYLYACGINLPDGES